MKRYLVLMILMVMVLTACASVGTFGKDDFSADDMAIIKVDSNERVSYGMSRSKAEKVLGKGESNGLMYRYPDGIIVAYREDKVVSIALRSGSEKKYKTARGSEFGMLKSEVLALHGEKHAVNVNPTGVDFYYDTKKREMLSELKPESEEAADRTYIATYSFDDNGYTNSIMLLDARFAVYFK